MVTVVVGYVDWGVQVSMGSGWQLLVDGWNEWRDPMESG